MSIVVEDGSGRSDANAYIGLEAFRAYTPHGGLSIPEDATDTDCEAAIIRGSAYIDGTFFARYPGLRYMIDQALEWPRYEAYDRDGWELLGVPRSIAAATCEAALVELNDPGALTAQQERGGMLVRKKTGPIEKEWAEHAPAATKYPAIEQALARVLCPRGKVRR